VFCHPEDWSAIYAKIQQEFGTSMLLRTCLRQDLGFVYRHHIGLVPRDQPLRDEPSMYYQPQVHLDFYNLAAQSWFQLKYLNL